MTILRVMFPPKKKQQYIDAYETWKINLKKLINK